jgi:hypothetical protein
MNYKKLNQLFTIVLLLLLTTNLFAKDEGYKISLKLNGYNDKVIFLANYYGDKQYIQDTVTLAKVGDPIVFEGKEKLKQGIYMIVIPSHKYFELMIGEDQIFDVETDTTDFVGHLKIKGSIDNELFLDYLKFTSKMGLPKQKKIHYQHLMKWQKLIH